MKRKLITVLTAICVLCTMSAPAFGVETVKDGEREAKAQSVESDSALKNATPISLNTSCSGSITENNDTNYYKFTLDSSGAINLQGTMYMRWIYITIFDDAGNTIYHKNPNWNGTTQQISYNDIIHLTSGNYFICFGKDGDHTGDYNFQLNYSPSNETFQERQNGSDNLLNQANIINVDTLYRGQMAINDDKDYYKFTLNSSGSINLQGTMYMQYAYITIFDSAGEKAWGRYEFSWNETTRQIALDEQIDLTSGTYYICVEQRYGATGNYNFRLNYASANESFKESGWGTNNDIPTASHISLNKRYYGQIADNDKKDFYRFSMPSAGKIEIKMTGYANLYLSVYDAAGNRLERWSKSVDSSKDSWNGDWILTLKKGGTYYFCAEEYYSTGNYNFSISNFIPAISVRSSFKKVQGDGSFQLNASVNDESSKLTYSSSNSKVATVSESGWVYIEGPGKATITVRVDGTSIKKNVRLTVAPSKPYLYKVTSGKRSLKATWDRNTKATGYQLVAATDKKFKKNKKTATLKKNKTVVKTLKKLKRKKVYYVKVRAYKQVGKTKVYSSYSNHRKVRIK